MQTANFDATRSRGLPHKSSVSPQHDMLPVHASTLLLEQSSDLEFGHFLHLLLTREVASGKSPFIQEDF